MMLQTPDLCGRFELTNNNEKIEWHLYDKIRIDIIVDPHDCYFNITLLEKVERSITHWHPTIYEIYDEVCNIGKHGNILVLRIFSVSGTVLYSGIKDNSPYSPDKKII